MVRIHPESPHKYSMKIHELINEDVGSDLERALDVHTKKLQQKQAEKEKAEKGSAFKKSYYRGKELPGQVSRSTPVRALKHVYHKLAR